MNRRRLILLLMTLVPAAILFVAAVIYVSVQATRLAKALDTTLEAELERSLDREIRAGRVETRPFGRIVVHDVAIAAGKTFQEGTMLTAERVEIRYSWMDLILRRRPAIQAVTSVAALRPDLNLIRKPNGRWNLSDLFRPSPGARPPFTGVVTIRDGRAEIEDYLAGPPGRRPARIRVRRINGRVDASTFPIITFDSNMISDRVARTRASGVYNARRGSLDIDVAAQDASAAFWSVYRPIVEPFKVQSGRFDAKLAVSRTITAGKLRWDYSGSAQLDSLSATVPQMREPLHTISGRVDFTTELVNLNLRAIAARSPLTARGTVVLRPRTNVRIALESKSLNMQTLVRAVPQASGLQQLELAGIGSARAVVLGPPGNLSVRATGFVPRARVAGYRAADIQLSLSYGGGILRIGRATGRALQGRVTVGGFIDLRTPAYPVDLSGTANAVDLALLPALRSASLTGTADARFVVRGSLASPAVDATVQVRQGTLNNIVFRSANMRVASARGIVTIRNFTANTLDGAVRASGTISAERIDLDVSALGVNIGQLARRLGVEAFAGIGYFEGRLSGSADDPSVVGTVEVFDGRVAGLDFDFARARIAGDRTAIALSDATVRRDAAEAEISGRILNLASGRPRLDLAIEIARLPVQELLQNLDIDMDAAGALSAKLSVTGPWPDVRVAGDLALTDGRISGFDIASATGSVVYEDGRTDITDLQASTNGTTLTADGSIARDGAIRFAFSGDGVPLAELNRTLQPYADLSGTADVAGTIGGTLGTPTASISVVSTDLEINGQKFSRFNARASWDGQAVRLSDVGLSADGETYAISRLAFNPESQWLDVQASARDGRIERLLAVIRQSNYLATTEGQRIRNILARIPQPISGAVDADLTLTGSLDRLQGTLGASTANVTLGAETVDSAEMLVTAERGSITLTRFSAVSGDLNVTASGDILRDSRTNLDIEAYNLDLALLRPWTGEIGLSGTATVIALISGPFLTPSVQASVEIVSPTIAGFRFDRIRASQIQVAGNRIELSEVILTRESYRASLNGTLPWDWTTLTVPRNMPIDLRAELEEQPLALLAALSEVVETEGTSGTIDGDVEIRGTLDRPDLTGSLSITDGSLNFAALDTPTPQGPTDFVNVNASVFFNEDRVSIQEFRGEATRGGTFTISGSTVLTDLPNGEVQLSLISEGLYIGGQNLTGVYNESIAARITSDIKISGPVSDPLISGTLLLTDSQIRLGARPETEAPPKFVLPINARLDIEITAGENVWIANPSVRAMITGSARLTGTASQPVLRGSAIVQRGTIRLPTARLEIRRGGVISIAYVPPEPGRIVLDMEATTSTTARSVLGGRRRYNIVMSIRGPVDNLALDVRSEPPGLPPERIYAILGQVEGLFDSGELALRQELTSIFTAAIAPQIFGPIETAFEEALNLEEFRLEYSQEEPLAVFLSRHLFNNFYASYWRIVSGGIGEENYRLSLSYRWTDRLQLSLSTNDQRESILEVEGILRY